jgi:serine/threonine protein kinase
LEDALEQAKREGRVPPMALERVTELLRGLCAVLTVAHQEGIVHRDLKPANILLPRAGGVKLLDFGIAKELTEQAQHTGYTGTPIFMAPEQLRGGGSVTAAADIYSLGVLLYQLLTGQLFYGRMPGPSEWLTDQGMVPAFSTAIDEVVFKALDFSPERRHQTPQELLQDYERALGLASVVAPATPPPSTGVQSKSWRQAARAARREDASYEEPPPEEPVVSSPERPVPRIRGRAARSAGPDVSYDSGMKVRSRDHGGKRSQKKKKKMPGALKVVLWLLFGLPIGMGLLGALISWFAYKNTSSTIQSQINKQIRSVISDAPTNVGDLKIDLSQVDEAFQKTALSSTASSSSSYSRKHKEWMKSFERRVNEIYTGTEVVSLYVRRISKKSTIYGFLNNNRIYGYQEGSDTLLFKIVQENDISIPYSQILRNRMNLRRKPYNRRPDNRQGGDEFDDGFDRLDGKKTTRRPSVGKTTGTTGSGMPSNHETMRYRIEDGYGWVYKTSTLPKGAPYYEFAINPLPMFYYTSLTRHSLILGNRRTYRSSSLYRTRVTRFNRFRGTVRSRRRTHYRSSKARSRLLRKRLRRLGRRYRSSYRRSGGKW